MDYDGLFSVDLWLFIVFCRFSALFHLETQRKGVQNPDVCPVLSQDRRYKEYHHPGTYVWNEAEKRYARAPIRV